MKNVDAPEHPNGARFRSQWLDLPDELDAASIKPIEVRRINAKLLLSTDDLAGYDCLKIARLRRSEQESTVFQLDAQYIPPLLQCSAWPLLQSQVLSATYDLMQQYSEQLGQQLIDAGNAIHGQTPIDLQRILVLQAINPAASIFRVLSTSRGIHPMTAYLELSRLAGALDLLHPERIAQATLPYDHENLGGIFFQLWRRILRTLESIQKVPYHQTTFVGTPHGMQISLAPQHFQKYRRWFIGIQKGAVSNDVVHDLLAPRHLDWKMGSATQVDRMFVQRAPGVELRACTQIPAALPRSDHWVFYEVMGLDSAAWKDVESTGRWPFAFENR